MSDSKQRVHYSSDTARFKVLLETLPTHFGRASKEQRREFLDFLEEWKYSLRRERPRKNCCVPVDFAVRDKAFSSMIRNISAGGVFIEKINGIFEGAQTMMAFQPPAWVNPLKIKGEVVWESDDGFGVKFTTTPYMENWLKIAVKTFRPAPKTHNAL